MNEVEIKLFARDVVLRCQKIVMDQLGFHLPVDIHWTLRDGSALGRATCRQGRGVLYLSQYIAMTLGEKYEDTIIHECAHALQYYLHSHPEHYPGPVSDMAKPYRGRFSYKAKYGEKGGHSKCWRWCMRLLGRDPNRCASHEEMAVLNAAAAKAGTHPLTGRPVPKSQQKMRYVYYCPTCDYKYRLSQTLHDRFMTGQRSGQRYCNNPKCTAPKGFNELRRLRTAGERVFVS